MPPRRGTRKTPARDAGAAAGPNEAGTAVGTSIAIENTRVRGAGLPASPSGYSTTYGSQAPRRVVAAPNGLRSVKSNVVDNLERDNEEADDEIVRRGEAQVRARGGRESVITRRPTMRLSAMERLEPVPGEKGRRGAKSSFRWLIWHRKKFVSQTSATRSETIKSNQKSVRKTS